MLFVPDWHMPSFTDLASHNTIHLWRLQLHAAPDRLSRYTQYLSTDERLRAERFYFDRDRHRFILTRGGLRELLGRYLHCNPTEVNFDYGSYGKPALAPPFADSKLQFNLSHSHEMAVYAFTCDRRIGVDIEHRRDIQDVDRLAQKVLSDRELIQLKKLEKTEKCSTFLTYWTCKEA